MPQGLLARNTLEVVRESETPNPPRLGCRDQAGTGVPVFQMSLRRRPADHLVPLGPVRSGLGLAPSGVILARFNAVSK